MRLVHAKFYQRLYYWLLDSKSQFARQFTLQKSRRQKTRPCPVCHMEKVNVWRHMQGIHSDEMGGPALRAAYQGLKKPKKLPLRYVCDVNRKLIINYLFIFNPGHARDVVTAWPIYNNMRKNTTRAKSVICKRVVVFHQRPPSRIFTPFCSMSATCHQKVPTLMQGAFKR